MVSKGKKNKQMLKIILCILILILVVYLGYKLYKNITTKSKPQLVKKKERYDYIPGLSSESVKTLDIKLKDAFNAAIGAIKDMQLNVGPLCKGSTLSRLILHDGDSCPGVAYTTSGGCKLDSPVGCICYERAEAGITKIKGLESLKVNNISNLIIIVNYSTNKVNVIFDMSAIVPKITVYGTAKATFPVCIKAMLGPDDDYLIETQILINAKNVVIQGEFNSDNSITLNTKNITIGNLDVNLKRSDWFSGAPGVIKTILDKTFGSIGDLWWDKITDIMTKFLNLNTLLNNALRSANTSFSVPYLGYLKNVSFLFSTIMTTSFRIGNWCIGSLNNNLVFTNVTTNRSCGFDEYINWNASLSTNINSNTIVAPLIHLGSEWIIYCSPKNDGLFNENDLVLMNPSKKFSLVLSISNYNWTLVDKVLPDNLINLFDSGLNYPIIGLDPFVIQPTSNGNLCVYTRISTPGKFFRMWMINSALKQFDTIGYVGVNPAKANVETLSAYDNPKTFIRDGGCLYNEDGTTQKCSVAIRPKNRGGPGGGFY
jgi:hypothetical protein